MEQFIAKLLSISVFAGVKICVPLLVEWHVTEKAYFDECN